MTLLGQAIKQSKSKIRATSEILGSFKRRRSREERSRDLSNSRDRKYLISEYITQQKQGYNTQAYDQTRAAKPSQRYEITEFDDDQNMEVIDVKYKTQRLNSIKRTTNKLRTSGELTSTFKTSTITPTRRKTGQCKLIHL